MAEDQPPTKISVAQTDEEKVLNTGRALLEHTIHWLLSN